MYPNMEERLRALEARLGVEFKNRTLLLTAVTHRSYLNEYRGTTWHHNEILEFLGDAVLELCVTDHLVSRFPTDWEGDLTNKRSAIVCTDTLAIIGEELQLSDAILMSHGQAKDHIPGSKPRKYIVACTVEAIIGALYRDQGIGECRLLVDQLFHTRVSQLVNDTVDHKSLLQDRVQAECGITPHYVLLSQSGPMHEQSFVFAVFAGKEKLATGEGMSKKEAQFRAAAVALANLKPPTTRRDV